MNLGGLDLNLLVALDALLSERSVTRAAQRVGLSQPGMSNALARLRRLLNDPLLVRQGATLVPTARAEALIGPVHEALELIRRALDAPLRFDPATDRRSFRLSCSDYSVLMLIGPLVRALAADAPGVVVESYRGSQMPVGRWSTATSTWSSSRRRSSVTPTSSRCACGMTAGNAAFGRAIRARAPEDRLPRYDLPVPNSVDARSVAAEGLGDRLKERRSA